MRTRRRTLVLGDESARHPFLATLPPHVRKVDREAAAPRQGWRAFLAAYCASVAAVFAFIV